MSLKIRKFENTCKQKDRTFKSNDPLHEGRLAAIDKESERLLKMLENILPEHTKKEIAQMDAIARYERLLGCWYYINMP